MNFSYVAPGPALQGFVRDYLIAHFVFDRDTSAPRKAYIPKPEQGMTFFVRGRPTMVNPRTGALHDAAPASLFGQQVLRCDVRLPAEFLMLRVHFRPGALFRMLRVPLHEFGESYFDAEQVLGPAVREVSERLAAARSYAAMIGVVERYLVMSTRTAEQNVHRVDRATEFMTTDPTHASLDFIARQACLSPRQLHRKFVERLGVGPKLYGRLIRFHRACQARSVHPTMSWSRIALQCGYTDYQHMVRDFRQFADATPNAWLAEDAASPENALADGHAV